MMRAAVARRQRILDEMIGGAGMVTKEVDVKKEDQVMNLVNMTDPAASSEPDFKHVRSVTRRDKCFSAPSGDSSTK